MAVKGSGKQGCDVSSCDRPHASKGLCAVHRERVRRTGSLEGVGRGARKGAPAIDRFMAKVTVNPTTGCWEWRGHIADNGYGTFRTSQELRGPAHRRGYELLRAPVPADLVLDHLCRVRSCVNPDHLEPVTHDENVARGERAQQTECKRGHALDAATDARGRRYCPTCKNLTSQEARASRTR